MRTMQVLKYMKGILEVINIFTWNIWKNKIIIFIIEIVII